MRPSTLTAALAEAAFMTGLERNADLVGMASYAPLFAHVDAWQWTPNLIWFDNLTSFGTPSYYVQQMFGQNRGTSILPVSIDGQGANGVGGVFASASLDAPSREVVVKLVNPGDETRSVALALTGATAVGARAVTLTGAADAENSIGSPTAIVPANAVVPLSHDAYAVPPHSVVVLRVRIS
jgi:alpha-N-arabinofuranosidase